MFLYAFAIRCTFENKGVDKAKTTVYTVYIQLGR